MFLSHSVRAVARPALSHRSRHPASTVARTGVGGTRGAPSVHHRPCDIPVAAGGRSGGSSIAASCSGRASCSSAARPASSQRSSQAATARLFGGVRRDRGQRGEGQREIASGAIDAGQHQPQHGRAPHSPAGRAKRQTGASRKAGSQSSPICARLPAMTDCSQASQGSVKSRGRAERTKSPRAGSLPIETHQDVGPGRHQAP